MPRRILQGVVLSDKQDKTVIVSVERRFTHPVLKKTVRRSKTFHAHDEKNEFSVGDIVWIEEHRPISKLKRWLVIRGEKRRKPDALPAVESEQAEVEAKKSRKIGAQTS
jgi:small subunit ribosomal protein S17